VLALGLQFIAPHLSHNLLQNLTANTRHHWRATSPGFTLHNPLLYKDNPPVCLKPEPHVDFAQTFYTDTTRSMALAEQAKRVAAEFDFDQDHVRKAVKEFIREMGMSSHTHMAGEDADAGQMRGCKRRAPS
jgi:hexokinase